MKRCPKCREDKEVDEFYVDRSRPSGRACWCAACVKAKTAAHRAGGYQAPRSSEYYAGNRRRSAQWKRDNPDKLRASRRAYRQRRRATAVGVLEHRLDAHRRRGARTPVEDVLHLAQDPCAYCGQPAGTLDHIVPLSAGGDGGWDNLTAACLPCNASKGARPLLQWLATRPIGAAA